MANEFTAFSIIWCRSTSFSLSSSGLFFEDGHLKHLFHLMAQPFTLFADYPAQTNILLLSLGIDGSLSICEASDMVDMGVFAS